PPESVSISLNPSGPPTEVSEVTLQCFVLNVASAENFAVTFYRGQMPLGHVKASNHRNEPVTQFWCEAKLDLGVEGPQPPLVGKSDNHSAVY
ncbi:hypothetical protein CCH79_00015047, partial [Gambusia affinis]